MEKIFVQAQLFDFYGEMLNEHQKAVFEDYVLNNIGISEIAQERGISRQSVHDLIKRCTRTLEEYEEKLHLVEKFEKTKGLIKKVDELIESIPREKDDKLIKEIKKTLGNILDEM